MITQVSTLPSGLRIATCEMPHAQTAAFGLWATVGGRHEPLELSGISHFTEHMLFKGTTKRSARQITQAVEGVGGDLNAYTSEERTCYYAVAAAEYFDRIADVICDIYADPKFSSAEIERERGVIGEEILMYRDEPSYHVQELFNELFWPKHALGRPLTGSMESIEELKREDFVSFHHRHYTAPGTVVTASGKICHTQVCELVAKKLASLPSGRRTPLKKPPAYASGGRLKIEFRETQQTHVILGLPVFDIHDSRRYALNLLNVILGGNASSRLFQELREKRGLCYSVGSHLTQFSDCGNLSISLGLDLKKLEQSIRLILREFIKLGQAGCSTSELRRAKEYTIGTSRMALERPSSQNSRLGCCLLTFGKALEPEEIHEKTRAVSVEDIRELALEILKPESVCLAGIGPIRDEETLRRVLQSR